jgi:hypothetical protein
MPGPSGAQSLGSLEGRAFARYYWLVPGSYLAPESVLTQLGLAVNPFVDPSVGLGLRRTGRA